MTARDKFRSDVKPVMSQSRMEHYPARHQHEGEERISGTGWNKSPESEERIEWARSCLLSRGGLWAQGVD